MSKFCYYYISINKLWITTTFSKGSSKVLHIFMNKSN